MHLSTDMTFPRILISIVAICCIGAAAGCGSSGGPITPVSASSCVASSSSGTPSACPALVAILGQSLKGKIFADLQPVSGASVQLYAAGSAGNGSSSVPLLAQTLTTDTTGGFTVPAGYSCPSAQTPIFLISKGGKPGSAVAANTSLWLMTALGACGSISAGSS